MNWILILQRSYTLSLPTETKGLQPNVQAYNEGYIDVDTSSITSNYFTLFLSLVRLSIFIIKFNRSNATWVFVSAIVRNNFFLLGFHVPRSRDENATILSALAVPVLYNKLSSRSAIYEHEVSVNWTDRARERKRERVGKNNTAAQPQKEWTRELQMKSNYCTTNF